MSSIMNYDGSIESANTPTSYNVQRTKDYSLYRCMIVDVLYIDSVLNITQKSTNPQVLYNAVILGGFAEGQLISNIRVSGLLGGQYNYHERIFRKTSKILNKDPLHKHDGDIVFVQFVQGDPNAPVIIGGGTNALDLQETGATIEDGPRSVHQFNGVQQILNKNGEFELTRKGGLYDANKDYFVPVGSDEAGDSEEDFQAKFHLLDNQMIWADPKSSIKVYKSGLSIEEDGAGDKVSINTVGGCKIEINGTDITLIDASGGTIKVSNGKIALGTSSTELVDVVSQLLQLLSTDLFNLGYPSANSAQYATLKTQVDTIKGSL
jgi:hypothetical protein